MHLRILIAAAVLAIAATQPARAQDSTSALADTVAPSLAGYAPSHVAAAESLLVVADMKNMLANTTEQMIQAQLQATPGLDQFDDILRDFMHEQLDWKVLEPEFVALYVQTFTEQELREIVAFYRTPLGRKLLAKTPELMQKGMAISQRRIQAAMPRMIARIQQRAQDLQKEGKLSPPPATKNP